MRPVSETIPDNPAPPILLVGGEGNDLAEEAKRLAQRFLCEKTNACGDCRACRRLLNGTHPDLLTLAPERGSIKIDEVRRLMDRVRFKPLEGDRMVLLLFDSDRMTEAAANALLKTLEEPPAYTHFLLTSESPERLPATVRSRCQRVRIKTSGELDRARWAPLHSIWREKILPRLTAVGLPRFSTASALAEEVAGLENAKELVSFLKIWWRDLLVYQKTGDPQLLLLASPEELAEVARRSGERLDSQFKLIVETEQAVEGNVLKQLAFERLFLKLLP